MFWGLLKIAGKIVDMLPNRKEKILTNIAKTREKMDALLKEKPVSGRSASRYTNLAIQLREYEKQLERL